MFTGNDKYIEVTLRNPNSTPYNITGCTFTWVLKLTKAAAALITKTSPTGVSIINAAGGILRVNIADTDTDPLTEAAHWHELKMVTVGLEEITILDGKIFMKKSIVP
jgi:hypothetical protein